MRQAVVQNSGIVKDDAMVFNFPQFGSAAQVLGITMTLLSALYARAHVLT